MDRGTGPQVRQAALASAEHGRRQGCADRPELQAVLWMDAGQGSRTDELARAAVEDRRVGRVGMDQLRSGTESDLLRHLEPGSVESGYAPRRQSLVHDDLRAQS